jgi:hypothetical protein
MDTKQNLKPELKEVYDRIMNTDIKNSKEKEPEKSVEHTETPHATPPPHETHIPEHSPAMPATPAHVDTPPHQLPNVNRDQSFAFSTKDHKLVSHNAKEHEEKNSDKGQKVSKEIIIALVVIFFIVYAGLCAVILGIIQF